MPSRILASLSLLLLTLFGAWAQPADEFFHGGAQLYLSNNIAAAQEAVTNGLKLHPDDVKLKKLSELLNQQQQQQQQDQKDQEQNQKDEPQQDQQKKDEQKQQQAKNDQQKADDKKDQQAKSGDKSKDNPEEKKETGEPQPVAAHAMTPEEAKQLLDAQKGDEQVLQFVPQGKPKNQSKQLKDW